ncbi:MAG TPA: hypothetical protein DDW84_00500 [Phycisphaerales bacterium]|nr:MAG: hypothetical protein A2Y13_01785 [Planctomycetes bacterium GWC2_45_44]HBG77314.1 hypothetical protein [Phycisphaerales bacterium]HBR19661.1 hypothetical protein [Phycisphaerales bacterium]
MKKCVLKFVFAVLVLLIPALCQAMTFTDDGTIGPGYNESTEIRNLATVGMTGGNSSNVWIRDYGTMNFSGGTVSHVRVENVGTMNLLSSSFRDIELRNSANFNIDGGQFEGRIATWDSSTININSGYVQQGWLESVNYTVANFYGGDTAWNFLTLRDYAIANIRGGNIHFTSFDLHGFASLNVFGGQIALDIPVSLFLRDSVTLNIYGGGSAILSNGFYLEDNSQINVYYSSIIYNEPGKCGPPILGYRLIDGSGFLLNQFTQTEISQINFIPEPMSLLLFGFGLLALRKSKK